MGVIITDRFYKRWFFMTRSEARRNAFLYVFQIYANDDVFMDEPIDLEDDLVLDSDVFTKQIVDTTLEHIEEIDDVIVSSLKGWTIDRLSKVSLAILRISIAQMLYMKDIPIGVVINEAVELSKHFGDKDDYQFINGSLSKIEKSIK